VAVLGLLTPSEGTDPWTRSDGWRLWGAAKQSVALNLGDDVVLVEVTTLGTNRFGAKFGDAELTLTVDPVDGGYVLDDGTRRSSANAVLHGQKVTVFMDGYAYGFNIPDPLAVALEEGAGGDAVIAPMTGSIRAVQTEAGAKVSAGDALILMEAMKMEHTLTAPRDGVVADVSAKAGDQVEEGTTLITLNPEGDAA